MVLGVFEFLITLFITIYNPSSGGLGCVCGNCFQVTLAANGKSADCSVEEEPWKREK